MRDGPGRDPVCRPNVRICEANSRQNRYHEFKYCSGPGIGTIPGRCVVSGSLYCGREVSRPAFDGLKPTEKAKFTNDVGIDHSPPESDLPNCFTVLAVLDAREF